MLLEDQNVQAEIRMLFLYKPRVSRTLIKIMQDTCDMGICPGKYICMDQSTNKSIYKDYVKEEIRMFAKNFKLKLVGPRTHGITPLDTLQRLYEPKDSINRDQDISKTCTIAKHTRKQQRLFEALAKLKLINL
ncbi:hypothetical protein MTR_3g005045 [Medicago truncatula]|uniref:Uncharacterized protein n=1 Tax=Medicago truncatula TaxID=3880 RepID=A0A072UUN2_MEDTR|nr:hypothetical protein MTR_3g005045 [Medicago truncatula]